jgi:hypothetical protein
MMNKMMSYIAFGRFLFLQALPTVKDRNGKPSPAVRLDRSIIDGRILYCKFYVKKSFLITLPSSVQGTKELIDFDSPFHIILAQGNELDYGDGNTTTTPGKAGTGSIDFEINVQLGTKSLR